MSSTVDLLASVGDSPFTIHNIPFGVISTEQNASPRCATVIGDYAIDLAAFSAAGRLDQVFSTRDENPLCRPCLNEFAALGREIRSRVRAVMIHDIESNAVPSECLIPLDQVIMHLPFRIGGFSDFYCSLEHVQNCSPMATNAAIPENWFCAPSVYNSRVSSVVPSPQPVRRPRGVFRDRASGKPTYGPSRELDYELEMGVFVSRPVAHESELDIADVEEHIFGFVLLNDWSARDVQIFEMKPLGPFHGKGFGTSISPWVITMEALSAFECPPKTTQDPAPFGHLKWPGANGTFDISLQVQLVRDRKTHDLGSSNLRYLYWTPFQQLAHHASAGCGMDTGDLIGTGTISGDAVDSEGRKVELGCLYEATQAGSKETVLPDGLRMKYLEDGDEIILRGWCGSPNGDGPYLGFGECRGVLLPAIEQKAL